VESRTSANRQNLHDIERRTGKQGIPLRILALVFAVCWAWLFIDAMTRPLAPFDLWGIQMIQSIDLPYLGAIIRPFDALTSSSGAMVTWFVLLAVFVATRHWLPALALCMLPLAGLVNNTIRDSVIIRERPYGHEEVLRTAGNIETSAFPSGHTLGAVLLYGLIIFLIRNYTNRRVRLTIQAGAVAMILIVGFARVWYGAHWPSDVLGAYAFGGLILIGIIALYQAIESHAARFTFLKPTVPATETENQHRRRQIQTRT
jgi:undecaprenyl-diphosphatase